jgi:hypothetical protein
MDEPTPDLSLSHALYLAEKRRTRRWRAIAFGVVVLAGLMIAENQRWRAGFDEQVRLRHDYQVRAQRATNALEASQAEANRWRRQAQWCPMASAPASSAQAFARGMMCEGEPDVIEYVDGNDNVILGPPVGP